MADTSAREPDSGSSIRFLSWNVKGINNPLKRLKIFSHLKRLNADIVFLQETHLPDRDHVKLRCPWVGEIFHSTFNTKARGVAILINKRVQFTTSKIIADKNGRYLIIAGTLCHNPILLVNIYAPNFDDPAFTDRLFANLPYLNTHLLILGGDLNCVIDPALDRSNPRLQAQSSMSKSISEFMLKNGCVDPWRFYNPQLKEFSFFSHVHQSYSRIDYFFVDSSLISKVISSEYHSIVISDHAPLSVNIKLLDRPRFLSPWRLNPLLLSDEAFNSFILSSIDDFIINNKNESVSSSLLWESLKAYLRGQIISYSAYSIKTRKAKLQELTTKIRDIDHQNAVNPSPSLQKQRLDLQTEFDLTATTDAERLLLHSRSNYYEHGDKPSRLLAHQLKRQATSRLIPQIKDSAGRLISDPTAINAVFKTFYSSLYDSESPSDTADMTSFLQSLETPEVDHVTAGGLDAPLSLEEVVFSIKAMQSNKAPGPDGFSVEFFKKFTNKLAPLLIAVYNESLERGSLPPTLTQASIALLLKKGKDPSLCASYRPLSLLNVDIKILAKALAIRLEKTLPAIISEEQNGFIKGRQLFFNVRTLLNVIFSEHSSVAPEVVISLDAEKAFDRVEWNYLFAVLHKFGFGKRFISWIRLLYTSPQASVHTNDAHSSYFALSRGTRQGCPLSPLLFALAIEPLSIAFRSLPIFRGVSRAGVELKLSLYADDLLLYVSDPLVSISSILSTLNRFGSFSGYKVNLLKSECYPINSSALLLQQSDVPFKLSPSGFKYLGINVTRTLPALYSANFSPLVSQIKADFHRWNSLPLSLIGRINAVKMNVLPRFLFLFQCIPLFLPKHFFKSVDQIVSTFLWRGKAPRVRKSLLHKFKFNGGLALPNFLLYYWSAHIQKLTYWLHSPGLLWCRLEARSCSSSSPLALLTTSLPTNPSRFTNSPVVLSTIKIWFQFRRHFKFMTASTLMPLVKNHLFPPSLTDATYTIWQSQGIKHFRDLYKDGIFFNFSDLSSQFNLPPSNLFRYFQIRHCASSLFPSYPSLPVNQPWDDLLSLKSSQKSLISKVYEILMTFDNQPITKTKIAWERELGVVFPDQWWDKAVHKIRSSAPCARLELIQFKVLFRVHYSKSRLSEIYPNVADQCDRCQASPCNLSHMFFFCPKLSKFWTDYFMILTKVLGIKVNMDPNIAIFGISVDSAKFNSTQSDVLAFTSLLARRRILLFWKSPKPPSVSLWLCDVMYFLRLEKIRFSVKGSLANFFL